MLVSVDSGLPLMRSSGSSVGDGVRRCPSGERGTGTARLTCDGESGAGCGTECSGIEGVPLPPPPLPLLPPARSRFSGDGMRPGKRGPPFVRGMPVTDGAGLVALEVEVLAGGLSCRVPRNLGMK